ncbi:hypothetical protein [Piscinibacter koreensis]|uniref:Uncharacterized protein n=1 Tax=Piscinibacter koreensis TaxID=2742824 RepID=A0A7Y6NKW1_9BURK|nr:hypothetical protein [Schlegelella koreensis]NUZ05083.1 hypothetical protein [Schlegelella koreensis]
MKARSEHMMSESFQRWFQRFVRWFFNSSPTALLDDETGWRDARGRDADPRAAHRAPRHQLTRFDAS